MDTLPTELLHRIFIQLPILQNKKCMLVCKKWLAIIQTRSLLNTVHINGKGSLNALERLLEKTPQMGLQLERLTVHGCKEGYFEKEPFFTIFPNLKAITTAPHFGRFFKNEQQQDNRPTTFTSQLQHIEDYYRCEFSLSLLRLGLGSCLVSLYLRPNLMDTVYNELFNELKDMPVLKKLTISCSAMTIGVLELLHDNIPSLETLSLETINPLSSTVPTLVRPAPKVTRLSIHGREDNVSSKYAWFEFIRKKYTHLKHFDNPISHYSHNDEWRDLYGMEYPLLLQNLGPQLTSLSLSSGLDRDHLVLKGLDASGCRLSTLKLNIHNDNLSILAQTKQFKWIQHFSLTEIPIDERLEKLKGMEALESLHLGFENPDPTFSLQDKAEQEARQIITRATRSLNELFRNIPLSVHSLEIKGHYVDYHDEDHTFPIRHLTLIDIKPLKRLDTFISKCLPYLHALTLTRLFNYNTTFVLPNHRFSHLEFDYANYDYNVSLVSLDCREPRFYSQHDYAHFCIHSNLHLPIPFDEMDHETLVTFVCHSVKRLVLNHREAYLAVDDAKLVV